MDNSLCSWSRSHEVYTEGNVSEAVVLTNVSVVLFEIAGGHVLHILTSSEFVLGLTAIVLP